MPLYSFQGREEKTGKMVTGTREAVSHAVLGQELLAEGVLLTKYTEQQKGAGLSGWLGRVFQRVSILERVLFTRYFGLMLRAGFDVKRSLAVLQEQTRSRTFKHILESIYHDVERGQTLTESMKKFPRVFSAIFLSFIRVGEATGKLQESLMILAQQLQKEYDLKRTVRGALLYPAVIVSALIAVGVTMFIFVIPRLAEVFEGFDVELPLATRIVLGLGIFFESYWYLVLLGLVIIAILGWLLLKIHRIKAGFLYALLFVPMIGTVMQKVNLARFNRNLSALLKSGVTFIEALRILGSNTPHPSYAAVFQQAEAHVQSGKSLSSYLVQWPHLFPPLVVSVVKIGEETGELSQVLEETAMFFEAEVDQTTKNLTSILEPVLMVIIGLAVGGLAISVISPIYNLVNVI